MSDDSKVVGPRAGGVLEYVEGSRRDVFPEGCAVSATGLEGDGTLCSASEKRDPPIKSF